MAESWLALHAKNTVGEKEELGAEFCREREDRGAISFQASVRTSYYKAHFIKIHFLLCGVLILRSTVQ